MDGPPDVVFGQGVAGVDPVADQGFGQPQGRGVGAGAQGPFPVVSVAQVREAADALEESAGKDEVGGGDCLLYTSRCV